jgi:hypothetical protein
MLYVCMQGARQTCQRICRNQACFPSTSNIPITAAGFGKSPFKSTNPHHAIIAIHPHLHHADAIRLPALRTPTMLADQRQLGKAISLHCLPLILRLRHLPYDTAPEAHSLPRMVCDTQLPSRNPGCHIANMIGTLYKGPQLPLFGPSFGTLGTLSVTYPPS